MKKLVTIVALAATVFSVPALAENSARAAGNAPAAWAQSYAQDDAWQSYAQDGAWQSYGQDSRRAQSPNRAFDVYDTEGHYVGSDPDPAIRLQLRDDNANDS